MPDFPKFFQRLTILSVLFLLPACQQYHATAEVDAVKTKTAGVENPFHAELLKNYQAFVGEEHDPERDYADAIHFARKGKDAGNDIAVAPEELADWNIDATYYPELHAAYLRMMKAFFDGATVGYPALSAAAQVNFDCWIEDQEEAGSVPSDTACKTNFLNTLAAIEDKIYTASAPAPVETPEPEIEYTSETLEDSKRVQTILFAFDKSTLTPDSEEQIKRIARDITDKEIGRVIVRGHTDASGSRGYNNMLSFERTMTVWRALIRNGVESRIIQMDWKGEDSLMKPTPDGEKVRFNRRVDVIY